MIGSRLDMFTTPQPTWVHGATGEIGLVPDNGSHVLEEGHLLVVMGLVDDLQRLPKN